MGKSHIHGKGNLRRKKKITFARSFVLANIKSNKNIDFNIKM